MRINLNAMGLFGSGKVTTPLYADSHIMQFYWKIVPNMGDPYVPTGISECNGMFLSSHQEGVKNLAQ